MKKKTAVGAVIVLILGLGTAAAFAFPGSSPSAEPPVTTTTTTTTTVPPPSGPETITPDTTVPPPPPGTSEQEVRATQQRLSDLGYWLGDVDGKTGTTTQQALWAFQKVHGLQRTGTIDAATIAALATASRPAPASTAGDLIEIDKKRQVIFVVRNGRTAWVFNTSTGTESSYVTNGVKGFAHTPTGTFKVNRKVDGVDPGDLGPLYRPRYFTNNGHAVHGAGSIPAYPASHGCARVSNPAMDFIWKNDLMPMQSAVWIYEDPNVQRFTVSATTTSTAPPAPLETTTTVAPVVESTTTTEVPPTTAPPTTTAETTTSTTKPEED